MGEVRLDVEVRERCGVIRRSVGVGGRWLGVGCKCDWGLGDGLEMVGCKCGVIRGRWLGDGLEMVGCKCDWGMGGWEMEAPNPDKSKFKKKHSTVCNRLCAASIYVIVTYVIAN